MAYNRYSKYQKQTAKPVAPAARLVRDWSQFQKNIFDDINSGDGNTQVNAYAGSGKTSTIVEGFYHVQPGLRSLMCAFNKSIQVELSARAPAGIDISTLHALGFKACRRAFPKINKIDDRGDKVRGYIRAEVGDDAETYELRDSLQKAVSLCKGYLAETPQDIDPILDRHDIDTCDKSREGFIVVVQKVLNACKADTSRIDFDDMIWFPNVLNLRLDSYDMVFIDEAQDLNGAQINLALRSCAQNGRIISVGDRYQAIYGFRGADSNAIQNIVDRCHSKEMPLSVTYRCARRIVELAQEIVPDIEASPTAEEGLVETLSSKRMIDMVRPGDFILSRVNAPLIGWCMECLKAGIPANIQGKDIGKSLMAMVKKSKTKDVPSFLDWLQEWKDIEVDRLVALKRDTSVPEDKAECLIALSEGTRDIDSFKNNIDKMFHDGDDKDRVILSSTHKAKGLERDRVFMLRDTYRPAKGQEEANLLYVATTRARKALYMVHGKR